MIQKETTRYIRHALKASGTSKEGKENGKDKDAKDAAIPGKVAQAYAELDQLANEKISLASRLVELLTRVSARLDHDLTKVVQLSGEPAHEQYEVRGGYVVGTLPGAPAPIQLSANTTLPPNSARSVKEVQDSLRASISQELTAVNVPSTPSAAQGPQKRKCNTIVVVVVCIAPKIFLFMLFVFSTSTCWLACVFYRSEIEYWRLGD